MIDAEHLLSGFDPLGQRLVEPDEVFLLDVSVAHFHERAAVHAYHHQVAHLEDETVAAPQVVEGLAGTLAPVVLMVARDDIERFCDAVEDAFHVAQLDVAAFVGEVAGHQHHVGVAGIDFGHRLAQFAFIGVTRRHMHVAQDGKPLGLNTQHTHGHHSHHCQ